MSIENEVNRLVEQKSWKREKPFPHTVRPSKEPLMKPVSRGEPWKIQIYAEDAPIPLEMFKVMDLHHQAKYPGFIGWCGGTITGGVEGTRGGKLARPTLFVSEVQSDLLQRTFEFSDPETYRKTVSARLRVSSTEYVKKHDELEAATAELASLRKEFKSSQAYYPLKKNYELQQRIQELEAEIPKLEVELEKILQDRHREFKYPKFHEWKSKLENYYKEWVEALYTAAIELAKVKKCVFFVIITANHLKEVWKNYLGEKEDSEIFDRAYDRVAVRLGLTRQTGPTGEWWVGRVAELPSLESVNLVGQLLGEEIVPPDRWKEHLQTYFRVFARQEGVNLDELDDYGKEEYVANVFRFWLDEVQPGLLNEPVWRTAVERFISQRYKVDVSSLWPDEIVGELPDEEITADEIDRLFNPPEGRERV